MHELFPQCISPTPPRALFGDARNRQCFIHHLPRRFRVDKIAVSLLPSIASLTARRKLDASPTPLSHRRP